MKLSRFLICGLTALAAAICLHACGGDDPVNPDPDPAPVVDPDNGEVTFVITNESGSGTGTVDAPAEVADGDTLSMVIRQKSSYTDSDGTVFTCEPEAKFSIHAVMDTVYAQNEDLLTKIEDSEVTTSKEGTNPVRNLTKQTIKVGPQSIKAEMLNEVYTYINKAQQTIEMPYAKWNELRAESPSADEGEEDAQQTEADVNITKTVVTLTPLPQTRAIVSDTTLHNVNLRLYGEVEVKNAKDETKQPVVIDVNYIGAVVTSMEVPDPENSFLSYDIEVAKGTGEGTEASPAIVSAGDSLRIEINQQSGYSDTDGTKVERNPKASIVLYASEDVVYATSKDELTALVGDGTTKTSKSGENPVRHSIEQTFDIGTKSLYQKADFEVYTYTNKAEKLIELPFVEIEPADAPTVTITEAAGTRAIVNDTAFYDITALTKYKVTSKNVIDAEETSQIIVCAVKYRGAVVTSTEIPDEDNGEVSFEIESDGIQGEGTAASPYIITPENALNLVIRQKSRYTDMDWSVFECEPLATINASLGKDVVYAESLDLLTSLAGEAEVNTSEEGDNPVRHAITQAYELGGMPIDFALGYEVYPYTTQAGETIEMPYGKLNPASYEGTRTQEASAKYAARISKPVVSAVPQTRATVSDTTMYDITATFNVELESVNAKETSKRTFVFAVTYPAGVITEKEVEDPDLVRVEYRTGYTWEEAHDNLPLLYYATVYRDRYYSNGEVITDTFVDTGHMVSFKVARTPEFGGYFTDRGIPIEWGEQTFENNSDGFEVGRAASKVPNPSLLVAGNVTERYDTKPGDWDAYVVSKLYNPSDFISATDIPTNGAWPNDNRESGWYFNNCGFRRNMEINYQAETLIEYVSRYSFNIDVYDQFLVIDGRRIDFLKYRPDFHYNLSIENGGGGVIVTCELRFTFMERDFYTAFIETFTAF